MNAPTTTPPAPTSAGPAGPNAPDTKWAVPPPPPSSSRSGIVIGAVVVIAILLVALGALLAVDADTTTRTDSFVDVTTISLDLDNADVELVAGTGDVVVDSEVGTSRLGGTATTEVRDGTLQVVYDCPWLNGLVFGLGCSGDYRLTVPEGVEVAGHTGNGDVRVTGMDGAVDLRSSNGDFHLADTAGPIEIHTTNGEVTGTELASGDVQATTSNGQVVLGFAAAPARVRVATSNGSVEVAVPDDGTSYAVDATTSNGSVSTDVPTDPSASRTLALRTSNGNVDVRSG